MLLNDRNWKPISNFTSITAGRVIAWNAANEFAMTAADSN